MRPRRFWHLPKMNVSFVWVFAFPVFYLAWARPGNKREDWTYILHWASNQSLYSGPLTSHCTTTTTATTEYYYENARCHMWWPPSYICTDTTAYGGRGMPRILIGWMRRGINWDTFFLWQYEVGERSQMMTSSTCGWFFFRLKVYGITVSLPHKSFVADLRF